MSRPEGEPGRWDSDYHAPVMAPEVVTLLGGARQVLDGTLGGGGHSLALLEAGASVTGVDRDPEALATARARLAAYERDGRFRAVLATYADLDSVTALAGERFDGILLDLGVSSHQFDDAERGFSFREGAPLDMRMGLAPGGDARELLAESSEEELSRILHEYADEPKARRMARELVRRRGNRPFETSDDLVGAIRAVLGPRSGPGDFARIFQGIRIAVNDELGGLARALPALRDRLTPGGVLVVIAYHSGEDRLVKQAFREWSTDCICPPRQLQCTCRGTALGETLTRKPVLAAPDEAARNPRARSAHLRAWRSAR
jgi:16S rRNA (cytosine1402-N4)-methyltransferase